MIEQPTDPKRPNIVVVGAGFAGLSFVQNCKGTGAEILLIDKQNHHLFQPLLYQVAMSGLAATEIAAPIRSIFSKRRDVTCLMAEVKGLDTERQMVHMDTHKLHYDYLILAAGGETSYFGQDHWKKHAPGLKTLNDALRMRREVLTSFERAEASLNTAEQDRLMTIVVVGGGPTGVELAGAMAELVHRTFRCDFRRIDTRTARVILVEGNDRLLKTYPEELSASAQRQLESMRVEVMLDARVAEVDGYGVTLLDGTRIETENVLWSAGVQASALTQALGVETDRARRIPVKADLSVPGLPNVFAVGDVVNVVDADGQPVPGVAPAAMQMGKHAARVVCHEVMHGPRPPEARPAFDYWDKGSMATIGRKRAVAWFGRLRISGMVAWLAWLLVHLLFLVSFRNKLAVLTEWVYSYVTFRRGARIIVPPDDADPLGSSKDSPPVVRAQTTEAGMPNV